MDPPTTMHTPQHRNLLVAGVGVVAAAIVVIAAVSGGSGTGATDSPVTASSTSVTPTIAISSPIAGDQNATTTSVASATPGTDASDLVGEDSSSGSSCVMTERSLGGGSSGESVTCLQTALAAAGYYTGPISGVYDNATSAAVEKLQTERDLFVDGKAGRETALSLGIWPDEQSMVVRTPPPAPGAVDSMGYLLSSVASTGAGAPPLPANSGSGRRIVYQRMGQRVWAVDENENIIRSWLVSGSKYNNETPGTHEVYSRSDMSTAWNGRAYLPKMVRWLKTDIGAIGFHAIPIHKSDNTPYQTDAELGTRLSGGCQRQANLDADFMWDFAQIGTPVVVL